MEPRPSELWWYVVVAAALGFGWSFGCALFQVVVNLFKRRP